MAIALAALEADPGAKLHAKVKALTMLNKMARNVIAHPLEPKYRSVRKANKTVATKILAVPHAATVAEALGFVDSGGDELALTPSEAGWLVLVDAQKYLERTLARLAAEPGASPPAAAAASSASSTSTTTSAAATPFGMPAAGTAAAPTAYGDGMVGGGGMGGGMGGGSDFTAMTQAMQHDPAMMQQMQAMMADPAVLAQARAAMEANPAMQAQAAALMANPNAMAELMRMLGQNPPGGRREFKHAQRAMLLRGSCGSCRQWRRRRQ
ncbi:uncharacterized protein AMSG_01853 [Thecamonas trahens ATCC 50062]|uniref:PUB domain-containing protein n=1 Tax=Thecamonas trahens ATCC 50062 TaxID=461836 RepID=A0A0L0DU77_THETB|nr:hypothetical protein AMSG_01853 [Thecamonas trahens ATCC 50062]KNC55586.1 hypothetical protein AMSG_01853 [Thecamonas trahens ATCC 50062]|eukprot:XP_013761359.1 hypothetical protein AMSG_01853 [Thecamonas trahens ATCC 50062]